MAAGGFDLDLDLVDYTEIGVDQLTKSKENRNEMPKAPASRSEVVGQEKTNGLLDSSESLDNPYKEVANIMCPSTPSGTGPMRASEALNLEQEMETFKIGLTKQRLSPKNEPETDICPYDKNHKVQ